MLQPTLTRLTHPHSFVCKYKTSRDQLANKLTGTTWRKDFKKYKYEQNNNSWLLLIKSNSRKKRSIDWLFLFLMFTHPHLLLFLFSVGCSWKGLLLDMKLKAVFVGRAVLRDKNPLLLINYCFTLSLLYSLTQFPLFLFFF